MKSLHKLRGMTGATALECAAVFRQQAAVIVMELHQRVQNGQSWHKYSPTISQSDSLFSRQPRIQKQV